MRIERIEEVRLGPDDEAEIAALLGRCFGTDFGGRSYFMQRHHLRFVLRDPQIVGHIGLTFRSVRAGGRLIPILGLADVATDPARRGEGIARALVDAAIDEGREGAAEAMMLFGVAKLYAAAGFRPINRHLRWVELDGARTGKVDEGPSAGLMVLPFEGDWPEGEIDLLGHKF